MTKISPSFTQKPKASLVLLYSGIPESPERGRHYALEKHEIIIGSGDETDIQLSAHATARRHAQLLHEEGQWWLTNLTNTNSVLVNGIPVGVHMFQYDGQVFQIGETILKFLSGQGHESDCFTEIYKREITDFLTHVYNKAFFHTSLDREIIRASRYRRSMSMVLIDLDEFGKVNKNFGQLVGDAVLKEAATRMQQCVRSTDILGRVGGEEFAVILPETSLEQARDLAERLRLKLGESPCVIDGNELTVTLSAGVATLEPGMTANELFQKTNYFLKSAKQNGRNQVDG